MDFPNACLHTLFEQQVERTPKHTAVVMDDSCLTYEELNRQSNQFAHYLIQHGVTPDQPVAISMKRSPDLIVALIGILKAGGAYVPLDPETPHSRQQQIIEDTGVVLCITDQATRPKLNQLTAEMLLLETWTTVLKTQLISSPKIAIQPDNLVSIYYTSGSSGKPKGVANMHKGWVTAILSMQKELKLQPGETILQKTNLTFDDAALEIFWPLLTGGRIALLEQNLHKDPEAIIKAIIQYNVAFVVLVSSMLGRILDVITPAQIIAMNGLRGCFGGGEALPVQMGRRYMQLNMPGHLYNLWGATEISIGSTLYKCTLEDCVGDEQIPIGRPLLNSRVYILNTDLQKVGEKVIGDLYVAGHGLAKGYINDPERTAKVFIEDPFVTRERMYRTGDQAYYRQDGSIQFVGRSDHQVKIRGIRVELSEIELALNAEEDIKEAAVILREDIPNIQRLTAYVVLYPECLLTTTQLKKRLEQKLPGYMIPHFIVWLDEMPLNANSKLDRLALPIPVIANPDTASVKLLTKWEAFLIGTFADVLNIEHARLNDDFFEIGGDSISASKVISLIRSFTNSDLPLSIIFEHRSVEQLVKYLEKKGYADDRLHIQPTLFSAGRPKIEQPEISFAQERLWFIQQIEPLNPAYNEPLAYHIEGSLHIEALTTAVQHMVNRHEALRTTFKIVNDRPVPVIADHLSIPLSIVGLEADTDTNTNKNIQNKLTEEARKSFNLEKGPLIRITLFKRNDDNHILFINMHHIITDAWSNVIFLNELNILYMAYVKHQSSPLLPLPLQYSDYSFWHKEHMVKKSFQKHLDFWKNELSGELPVIQLPTDKPRPPIQNFNGDRTYFNLSEQSCIHIRELGHQIKASSYMVLQAVFNIMLHRYSGQNDIIVGSPVANRNHYGIEHILGFFVNTVAIRSHYDGAETFRTYMDKMKTRCLNVYEHQDMPFELLVRELQPERNQAYSPIVQVMFAYQNQLEEMLELGDLNVSSIEVNSKTSRFDITLFLKENANGQIQGTFEFNTQLFEKETIDRMISSFKVLLATILQQPDWSISSLPLLSSMDRQMILYEWNNTAVPFPAELCLHELVELQAEQTPQRIAAVYQNKELTYEQLEKQSNQLAHELLQHDLGTHKVIGICLERSLEMVISLLAILKAGAAFAPIDTELPLNRIEHILQDSDIKVCIIQKHQKPHLILKNTYLICADISVQQPTSRPNRNVSVYSPVSIYYTSGSTGKPKGVINIHQGWVNRMCWMQRQFRLQPGETVLQKTTLTFDDAAVEFFWPLICGGRIALLEPGLHRDPRAIIDACIKYEAVHLQFVPSMLNLFLDELTPVDQQQLSKLRSTISSGEALTANTIKRFFDKLSSSLNNTWGATEVSIDSTLHTATEADLETEGAVCIGKPIDNNRCYVLDDYLQPVPPGVTGHLYLAGVGLAHSYQNLPEKTAQVFVDDPFVTGERMYSTGDLGFYRADSSLQFVGRLDNQIKIRGMRVELGEIEAAFLSHANVKEVIVIADKDTLGLKRLLAYIVPLDPTLDSCTKLREHAKELLPDYMVPSFIILLDQMPLNANGKIDRSQLVKPEYSDHHTVVHFVEPQTQTEHYIAGIWCELLGLKQIGIHDHFFDLGGHSLLATQIVSRIRRHLMLDIALREVFLHPTIEQFSSKVEQLLYEKIEQMSAEEMEALME